MVRAVLAALALQTFLPNFGLLADIAGDIAQNTFAAPHAFSDRNNLSLVGFHESEGKVSKPAEHISPREMAFDGERLTVHEAVNVFAGNCCKNEHSIFNVPRWNGADGGASKAGSVDITVPKDGKPSLGNYANGWRLAAIFEPWPAPYGSAFDRVFGFNARQIRPDLRLPNAPIFREGFPNEENAEAGQDHLHDGNPKHGRSPAGYLLLGGKIAAGLVLFLIGGLLVICGFKRAGNALDRVLDGSQVGWCGVSGWFGAAVCGAGLSASVVTYALQVCCVGR